MGRTGLGAPSAFERPFIEVEGNVFRSINGKSYVVNKKVSIRSLEARFLWFEALKLSIINSKYINSPLDNIGTIYYVSNDGNDTNDGLTEDTALATLAAAKLKLQNAGDSILLRRGDIWNEIIELSGSTFFSDDTYTAYFGCYGDESLPQPIISGLRTDHIATWVDNGDGTWSGEYTGYNCKRLWENDVEILPSTDLTLEPLGDYFRWFSEIIDEPTSLCRLTVFGDPTGKEYKFATVSFSVYFYQTSNTVFQDIDARGSASQGVYFNEIDSMTSRNFQMGRRAVKGMYTRWVSNSSFTNFVCDAEFELDSSLGGTHAGSSVRGPVDGVNPQPYTRGCTFERGYIKNWCHASINAVGNIDNPIENTHFRNMYCTAPNVWYGGRIAFDSETHHCSFTDSLITDIAVRNQFNGHDNIFARNIVHKVRDSKFKTNVSQGISLEQYAGMVYRNKLFSNIFMDCASGAIMIDDALTENDHIHDCELYDNIIYNCPVAVTFIDYDETHNNKVSNISYFNDNGNTTPFKVNGTLYTPDDFNALSDDFVGNRINNDIPSLLFDGSISAKTGSFLQFNGTGGLVADTKDVFTKGLTFSFFLKAANYGDQYLLETSSRIVWLNGLTLRVYVDGGNKDIATLEDGKEYFVQVIMTQYGFQAYLDNRIVANHSTSGVFTGNQVSIAQARGDASYAVSGLGNVIVLNYAVDSSERDYMYFNPEATFRHCNAEDSYTDENLSFTIDDVFVNMPLNMNSATQKNYADGLDYTIANFDDTYYQWGIGRGLQKLPFDTNMQKETNMGFDPSQYDVILCDTPTPPWSFQDWGDKGDYLYTDDGTTRKLYINGVEQPTPDAYPDAVIVLDDTSRLGAGAIKLRRVAKVWDKIVKPSVKCDKPDGEFLDNWSFDCGAWYWGFDSAYPATITDNGDGSLHLKTNSNFGSLVPHNQTFEAADWVIEVKFRNQVGNGKISFRRPNGTWVSTPTIGDGVHQSNPFSGAIAEIHVGADGDDTYEADYEYISLKRRTRDYITYHGSRLQYHGEDLWI